MKTDTVITLKDGKKYLLLLESELDLEGYFLSVLLDEKDEPSSDYAIIQEVEKDGKLFAKKIDDPVILDKLLEDYKIQYSEQYEEAA